MIIHEFGARLRDFMSSGSFGVEELDEHMGSLDTTLRALGLDPASRIYALLLSFLINQGTEWDAFAMPFLNSPILRAVLSHGRRVEIPDGVVAEFIVLRKPPISQRVIELKPAFQFKADPLNIRAPAACFMAYPDASLLRAHAEALRHNRFDGQAYGFLVRLPLAQKDEFLATFTPMFEPVNVSLWTNAPGVDGEDVVIALITTSLDPYEV